MTLGPLTVIKLGLRPYADVWQLQRELQRKRIEKLIPDTLVACQHSPTITLGTSAKSENILVAREELSRRGIEVFEVERGGDVTFHGPGQLVLYPILDLNDHKRDVHWYMRILEEIILRVLADYKIQGQRISGRTGVWVALGSHSGDDRPRKIASLGVKISRWCSMHGTALNVTPQPSFQFLNPCGFNDIAITSMAEEYKRSGSSSEIRFDLVEDCAINHFAETLGFSNIKVEAL